MDALFISTEDLKNNSLIQENVDDKILEVVILRVQKYVLRPILGTAFYKSLSERINNEEALTDLESEMMDDYVFPLMTVACDRKSIKAVTYQIRNKAVSKGEDPFIQAVNESEGLNLDNDLRLDIKIAKDDLIGWLCDNGQNIEAYKNQEINSENIQPTHDKGGDLNFSLM